MVRIVHMSLFYRMDLKISEPKSEFLTKTENWRFGQNSKFRLGKTICWFRVWLRIQELRIVPLDPSRQVSIEEINLSIFLWYSGVTYWISYKKSEKINQICLFGIACWGHHGNMYRHDWFQSDACSNLAREAHLLWRRYDDWCHHSIHWAPNDDLAGNPKVRQDS